MKITKDENGNLVITISEQEIKDALLTDMNPVVQKNENPFRFLREYTIEFLKKLDEKYKTKTIMRNDPFLVQLTRKYYITDLAQILRKLEKKGYATYARGVDNRIDSFQLLINGKY